MVSQFESLDMRIQDYVTRLRSHSDVKVGGKPISRMNLDILSRAFEAWLFLIEDLMLRHGLEEIARCTRMCNCASAFIESDLLSSISFLDEVYLYLIRDTSGDIPAFKQQLLSLSSSRDIDYRRLLSPISHLVYSFLSETDNKKKAHFLTSICQFLRFLRKLEFQDIGLEAQAIEGYVETEQELEAFKNEDDDMLNCISDIIARWFGDFHIDDLRPTNGPGSVAEGPLTVPEKFAVMNVDKTLEVLLRTNVDPDSHLGYFPIHPGKDLDRCSRTIFVPKTFTKLRTISMEPATLQYIQQGVMFELYDYIGKHPYLGVRIKLSDQCQNQVMALEGSKYHNYGTIDLSHASDSVSWSLIKRVFRSSPRLYRWLLGTRSSSTILPTGERLRLYKYAPMGSALCFPIQCILFCAVVKHALDNVTERCNGPQDLYTVYGDDIVLPSQAYEECIRILQALGFTVNESKSYCSGEYRESCGKEYYAGYDVSPVYYRIPYYRNRMSPAAYGSLCGSANNAFLHGLPLYRRFLLTRLLAMRGLLSKPYFTRTPAMSPYLYSSAPTNFHVKTRWNRNYQRYEGRFCVVKTRPRDKELNDDIRYHCQLVNMSRRGTNPPPYHVDEPCGPPITVSGQVELFGSSYLPTVARLQSDKTISHDW